MVYAATRECAHELIERMVPEQLEVVIPLLAVIVDPVSPSLAAVPWEDEEISAEEDGAVARAKAESGPGTSMEDLMAELGITQDDLDRVRQKVMQEQSSAA